MLENLKLERLKSGIESGHILIDVDARIGHNHGIKSRLRQGAAVCHLILKVQFIQLQRG